VSYPRRKITGKGWQYLLEYKKRNKHGRAKGNFIKYPVLFLECGHYVEARYGYVPKNWTTCYECEIIARFWNIITGGLYMKQQVMREPFYEGDNPRNYFGTVGKYTDFAEHVTDFKIMWQ
jgi:hypothetical protein